MILEYGRRWSKLRMRATGDLLAGESRALASPWSKRMHCILSHGTLLRINVHLNQYDQPLGT